MCCTCFVTVSQMPHKNTLACDRGCYFSQGRGGVSRPARRNVLGFLGFMSAWHFLSKRTWAKDLPDLQTGLSSGRMGVAPAGAASFSLPEPGAARAMAVRAVGALDGLTTRKATTT